MLDAAFPAVWRTDNDECLSRSPLFGAQSFVSDLEPAAETHSIFAKQRGEKILNRLEVAFDRLNQTRGLAREHSAARQIINTRRRAADVRRKIYRVRFGCLFKYAVNLRIRFARVDVCFVPEFVAHAQFAPHFGCAHFEKPRARAVHTTQEINRRAVEPIQSQLIEHGHRIKRRPRRVAAILRQCWRACWHRLFHARSGFQRSGNVHRLSARPIVRVLVFCGNRYAENLARRVRGNVSQPFLASAFTILLRIVLRPCVNRAGSSHGKAAIARAASNQHGTLYQRALVPGHRVHDGERIPLRFENERAFYGR